MARRGRLSRVPHDSPASPETQNGRPWHTWPVRTPVTRDGSHRCGRGGVAPRMLPARAEGSQVVTCTRSSRFRSHRPQRRGLRRWSGPALLRGPGRLQLSRPTFVKDDPRAGLAELRRASARHGAAPVPAAGAPVDRDWGGGRPVVPRPTQRQPTPLCALSLPGRGRPCPGPSLTRTPRDEAGPTRDPTTAGAAALGPRPSRPPASAFTGEAGGHWKSSHFLWQRTR